MAYITQKRVYYYGILARSQMNRGTDFTQSKCHTFAIITASIL